MASNTPNLGLYKKDPILDKNDTFNITTMLNENWDRIDEDSKQKDNKIDILSGASGTKEKANKSDLDEHKAQKATQNEFGHIQVGNGLSVTSGVVSHPTTAGNKHIPSGGAINQILEYSASGTAKWGRKITFGTADPAGGEDGDIYFQYE